MKLKLLERKKQKNLHCIYYTGFVRNNTSSIWTKCLQAIRSGWSMLIRFMPQNPKTAQLRAVKLGANQVEILLGECIFAIAEHSEQQSHTLQFF